MTSILYQVPLSLFAFILFVFILVAHLLGVRTGSYQRKKHPEAVSNGIGPLETALLGLLSLLLSFTFSMSASRYDSRRTAIVSEANAIGTSILDADLYPDSIRTVLRSNLRQYLNERIQYYQYTNAEEMDASILKAQAIHLNIWKIVAASSNDPANTVRAYHTIPAVQAMADTLTSRDAILKARVPYFIIWLLVILALLGSFIIGYAKKERKNDWIILSIYALMMVITLYTILDLDTSRNGLINTDATHVKIEELQDMLNQ